MPGIHNYEGSSCATLDIGEMSRRSPEPAYRAVCRVCQSKYDAIPQSQLRYASARCKFSGCGKVSHSRNIATEQHREISDIEAERDAAVREASNRRMEAETSGHRVAPRRIVIGNDGPETERQRLERKEREAELERERIAADAPRLEAERQAAIREQHEQENRERQRAYWKDAVLTSPDTKLTISPELAAASMPAGKVDSHNVAQVNQFIAETPEYGEFRTPQNATEIVAYLERNGLRIFDVPTLRSAFVRLRDLGILTKRVVPEPPKPTPTPAKVNLAVSEQPQRSTQTYRGRDPLTGQERSYTQREVDRMSSDEYRRRFPVETSINAIVANALWPAD